MPSIRVGYGSDFVVKNQRVGIGTEDPRATLEVLGGIKANFEISGVTTLTSYAGFIPQKQNIATKSTTIGVSTIGVGTLVQSYETETGYESLVGEFNTLSDDLIVDDGKIFEIKTTSITGVTTIGTQSYDYDTSTVSLGALESISIQSHFTLPNGGIETRPENPIEGTVRFNDDLNTLEFYNGIEWRQFTVTGASGRGVIAGGYDSSVNVSTIEFVNISSLGNASSFGDLTRDERLSAPVSSSTRGIFAGGYRAQPTVDTNVIDYITIASEGDAIDFGELYQDTSISSGASSSTRGVIFGGYVAPAPGSDTNIIQYIEMSTLGNSIDFGDLSAARRGMASSNSSTRGIVAGGSGQKTLIEYVTIASLGNSIYFGDLTHGRRMDGCNASGSTRGLFAGGSPGSNIIDYITIASIGNATDFGDLTSTINYNCSFASNTRGLFAGGTEPGPVYVNTIEYVQIATAGDAVDFGDMSQTKFQMMALSDSHGGLGGF
jgi:hypothetical protein